MTPPTDATLKRIDRLFPPEQRRHVAEILERECGNNLPFLEGADAHALERFHIAALKLSEGTLEGLHKAVELAKIDWRDLLVSASYSGTADAHNHGESPGGDGGRSRGAPNPVRPDTGPARGRDMEAGVTRRLEALLVPLFGLGASACMAEPTSPAVSPMPAATTPASRASPTARAPSALQRDLDMRPLIFFGPLPHPSGSLDFMDLFSEASQWEAVSERIHVFELYGGWVVRFPWEPPEATQAELEQIVSDLNRRGMAIGFEAGPLVATDQCGRGIEGFFGPEEGLPIVLRLKELGAEVSYVSLDEPFAFANIYDGPNACQWSPEKIALQVQDYIDTIHGVFPDAVVGDNEPLWAGVSVDRLIEWLDAYRAATGSNLPFIHLDLDYSRPDWPEAALRLEAAARERGVEFGIFYMGDSRDASDSQWAAKALQRARTYELEAGGRPDHVIFQSWHDHPDYVLPESNPETFTGLINAYLQLLEEAP